MANEARWSRAKIDSWVLLNGQKLPVTAWQVDYELNSIPRASIRLPLGRDIVTAAASPIHTIVAELVEHTKVELWAKFTDQNRSDNQISDLGIPAGAFRVFDGFTAGGGYVKNNQGVAAYVLNCNHWLVQLGQGSIFSQSSHPGNPSRYAYGALMEGAKDTGGLNWTVLSEASAFVTPSSLSTDVWGSALYPWFQALVKKDGIQIAVRGIQGAPGNAQAQAAMDKLKPGGKWYVPSKIKSTISIDVDIATEVANDVAALTYSVDTLAHQTLWDVLAAKFVPDYFLGIVPRVDDALVVPFLPCYRGGKTPFKVLPAEEYVAIQLESPMRRPVRAVGILSGIATRSGMEATGDGPEDELMGVGGWYDANKEGTVIITGSPTWTHMILSPSRYSDKASGGNLQPNGSGVFPGAGGGTGSNAQAQQRAASAIKPLLDAIAQSRYANEILQGRYGVFAGPFRVDIAPGSTISVRGAAETFIADQDKLGIPYVGQVLRVSLMVDAQGGAAGSAFHVGYTRTEDENKSNNTSIEEHPLYEQTFPGAPLVDQ